MLFSPLKIYLLLFSFFILNILFPFSVNALSVYCPGSPWFIKKISLDSKTLPNEFLKSQTFARITNKSNVPLYVYENGKKRKIVNNQVYFLKDKKWIPLKRSFPLKKHYNSTSYNNELFPERFVSNPERRVEPVRFISVVETRLKALGVSADKLDLIKEKGNKYGPGRGNSTLAPQEVNFSFKVFYQKKEHIVQGKRTLELNEKYDPHLIPGKGSCSRK